MREQYLIHWRTKGSKNGERRYQYEDGTYTPLGKLRRRVDSKLSDIGSRPNGLDYQGIYRSSNSGRRIQSDGEVDTSRRWEPTDDGYGLKSENAKYFEDGPSKENDKKKDQPKQEKKQDKQDKQEQVKQDQKKDKNQSNPPKYDAVFKDASKLTASLQKITKVKAHNEKVDARNAKIAQMTDKELEEVNKRLGLEKRYKELLDNKASEKAKVEVSDILEAFGNTVAVIQDLSAIGRAILQEKDN